MKIAIAQSFRAILRAGTGSADKAKVCIVLLVYRTGSLPPKVEKASLGPGAESLELLTVSLLCCFGRVIKVDFDLESPRLVQTSGSGKAAHSAWVLLKSADMGCIDWFIFAEVVSLTDFGQDSDFVLLLSAVDASS